MNDVSRMSESELRDFKAIWPKSMEELTGHINQLVERDHDYGTCVYAMSLAAVAAFYYVSHKLGVTGFQASCADMDFLQRTRSMKSGFKILDYDDLLYPQSLYKFNKTISPALLDSLKKEASKNLEASPEAHPEVVAHWRLLADGNLPDGFSVSKE